MSASRSKKIARHISDEQVRKGFMGDFFPEDIHAYRVDRHNFVIYLGGDPAQAGNMPVGEEPGVEHTMADRFEINLNILSGIDKTRPILVIMASCGGNTEEGLQIFDAILNCTNPITVLAAKAARSMTSIIPLAADLFLMSSSVKYMIHRGTYANENVDEVIETDDIERRKSNELMFQIYTARLKSQGAYSGWKEENIRDMLEERMRKHIDVYLSAYEAMRWGFVDDVVDSHGTKSIPRATEIHHERRKTMTAMLNLDIDVEVKVKVKPGVKPRHKLKIKTTC